MKTNKVKPTKKFQSHPHVLISSQPDVREIGIPLQQCLDLVKQVSHQVANVMFLVKLESMGVWDLDSEASSESPQSWSNGAVHRNEE
jgi:hypothetical protein